jgi:hypothetical protein
MLDTCKELMANQFEAAFCTLNMCIDRCPEESWNAPVVNHPFCRVAFHALLYADYYLEPGEASFRQQAFHRDNPEFFRDYEELEDREPVLLYEREPVRRYLQHCRAKATRVVAAETADILRGPSGFPRRDFSRAEMHVYNIRHVFHHAVQLSMRLRIDHGEAIPWIGYGWREPDDG